MNVYLFRVYHRPAYSTERVCRIVALTARDEDHAIKLLELRYPHQHEAYVLGEMEPSIEGAQIEAQP